MSSGPQTIRMLSIVSIVSILAVGCVKMDIPGERHLADCTTNSLRFLMDVENQPPYHILLGSPRTAPFDSQGHPVSPRLDWRPEFQGEIMFTDDSGKCISIAIDSGASKQCNWLERDHGMQALIVGSPALKRGKTYDVQIAFTKAPPRGSSIWLSEMRRRAQPL